MSVTVPLAELHTQPLHLRVQWCLQHLRACDKQQFQTSFGRSAIAAHGVAWAVCGCEFKDEFDRVDLLEKLDTRVCTALMLLAHESHAYVGRQDTVGRLRLYKCNYLAELLRGIMDRLAESADAANKTSSFDKDQLFDSLPDTVSLTQYDIQTLIGH